MKGIDVSYYQGKINFEKVKKDKVEFVIIRIGYGMYENQKDKNFEYNYNECRRLNIPVGVYHYTYAKTKGEALKEANLVLKWLNKRKLNLPVYMDVEDSTLKNINKKMLTTIIKTFCERIEKGGYWAGVYANKYFAENKIEGKKIGKRFTFWVAQYNNVNTYLGPYDMWQYSSNGKVKGIDGNVDLNYLSKSLFLKMNKNVTYKVYDNVKKIWLPSVINNSDYAGNLGNPISGLSIIPSEGEVMYRVHEKNGKWLPIVVNKNDYAGNLGKVIDGVQMKYNLGDIYYRVHLKNGKFLDWVNKWDNTSSGYAGIYGKEIDAIEIYLK